MPRRRPVGIVAEFGFAVGQVIAAVARKLAGSCIDSSGFVARIDSATSERRRRRMNSGSIPNFLSNHYSRSIKNIDPTCCCC